MKATATRRGLAVDDMVIEERNELELEPASRLTFHLISSAAVYRCVHHWSLHMPPITATTYAHTIDALVKVQDGHGLARNFDLLDFHVEPLLQGLNPREKTLDIVRSCRACLYS